jgi:hypothetical protein
MSYGSYNNGCTDYAVPEICEPMNWYCDGWCQEACKEGWSLTWDWDQEAANNGDWENASVPVCQKCEGEGESYFVWTGQDGRICVGGSKPDRHEKPDALRNDWGYDWCEWPAQMDWENGGCWEYSCQSGFAPQWAQNANPQSGGEGGATGSGGDYGQVCLDQERKDVECPPGMGEMSIWEEGETMNQWGYYNWEEKKYCVKTRPMKELKTPRHDLHKVFHYFDWIVKDETTMEEEEIPAEAATEDFDTTDGTWVDEQTNEPTVYENDEEYLLPIAGENFEDENEHDVLPAETWEEEHKDVDPNLFADSGMATDMADGELTNAGEYFDSGMDTAAGTYDDAAGTANDWDSGYGDYDTAAGTYDTAAGGANDWDSGMDTAAGTYDTAAGTAGDWDSGIDTTTGGAADGTYDTAATGSAAGSFDEPAASTATAAGTGYGSGTFHKKRHNRHH